jgi:hypothetical protein
VTDRLTIAEFKALKKKKPSKYRNEKTVVDGIEFASKKEAARFADLRLLVKAGKIGELQIQQVYPLVVNGKKVCDYQADFTYIDMADKKLVVEDCKGFRTPAYRIKAKLFFACNGYRILET